MSNWRYTVIDLKLAIEWDEENAERDYRYEEKRTNPSTRRARATYIQDSNSSKACRTRRTNEKINMYIPLQCLQDPV